MCTPIISARSESRNPAPDFAAIAARLGLPYLHQRPDGSWAVPSDSDAGAEYTVWLTVPHDPTCTCEGFQYRRHCYHIDVAQARAQIAAAAVPAPVLYCEAQDAYLVPDAAPAPPVDKQARYRAAYADVFGSAA
jgi:hypothetical protein